MPSPTAALVKSGVKTLYWSVVLLALFFTMFVLLFPYTSLKLYMKTDNKLRALECADRYYNLHKNEYNSLQPQYDSKFADSLYAGVNLSRSLLDNALKKGSDKAVMRYAKYAERLSSAYLSYDSLQERSDIVDSYSISHSLPSMHAAVYSFENTAAVLREKSRFILNGPQSSLEYFYDAMLNDLLIAENFEITEENADRYIKIFNQLSAIIDYELNKIGLYEKAKFSSNGGLLRGSLANANLDFDGSQFVLLFLRSELRFTEDGQAYRGVSPLIRWASRPDLLTDPARSRGLEYWVKEFTLFVANYRGDYTKRVFWVKSLADLTERIFYAFTVMDCNLNWYSESQHSAISECADKWEELNQIDLNGGMSLTDWYRSEVLPQYRDYIASK